MKKKIIKKHKNKKKHCKKKFVNIHEKSKFSLRFESTFLKRWLLEKIVLKATIFFVSFLRVSDRSD